MRPIDCDALVTFLRDMAGCNSCHNCNGIRCRACTWDDAITAVDDFGDNHPITFGHWRQEHGYATAGGDPVFVCGSCGGSLHVYGVEHPKKRIVCSECGAINIYPWEKVELEE